MKHIKEYKIFESKDSIIQELNDMVLELKDGGDRVKFELNDGGDINMNFISAGKHTLSGFFNTHEFKRVYEYLYEEGYTRYYLYVNSRDSGNIISRPSTDDKPWNDNDEDVELRDG